MAGKEDFVLDLDGLFFEDLLAQAVESPTNEAAQLALQGYVQEVLQSGDLERTMTLGMMLGATACLHPHLESTANSFASIRDDRKPHEDNLHEHDHDGEHEHGRSGKNITVSSKDVARKQTSPRQGLRFADIILKYFRKKSSPAVMHARRNIDPTRQKSV